MCSLTDKPAVLLRALIVCAKHDKYKFIPIFAAEIIKRESDMLISYITSSCSVDQFFNISKLAKDDIDFYYHDIPEDDRKPLASVLATFFSAETAACKVWIALRYLAEVVHVVRRCVFGTKDGPHLSHLIWLQTANLPAKVLPQEFARMLAAFKDMKISKPEISLEDLEQRAFEIDSKCLRDQMPAPHH